MLDINVLRYLGFPRRAAWCNALKPLLFVRVMSAPCSNNKVNMSSRFFEMASCKGVSPSESCNRKIQQNINFGLHTYRFTVKGGRSVPTDELGQYVL